MVAAEGLVDEGERGLRGLEEERVVVTTDEAVEGCELGGRKGLDVPRRNVSVLRHGKYPFTHRHRRGEAKTDDVVCDSKQ